MQDLPNGGGHPCWCSTSFVIKVAPRKSAEGAVSIRSLGCVLLVIALLSTEKVINMVAVINNPEPRRRQPCRPMRQGGGGGANWGGGGADASISPRALETLGTPLCHGPTL